jgi:hypothetical protein
MAHHKDIIFNKPLKKVVHQEFCNWSIIHVAKQIRGGMVVKDCKLDVVVNNLRNEGIHYMYVG